MSESRRRRRDDDVDWLEDKDLCVAPSTCRQVSGSPISRAALVSADDAFLSCCVEYLFVHVCECGNVNACARARACVCECVCVCMCVYECVGVCVDVLVPVNRLKYERSG